MTDVVEYRRSILRKMQAHPDCVTLSELIFKRMPMKTLTLIAPIVLEKIEDGFSSFDSLTSSAFCHNFLKRHYKDDTILELLGKQFHAKKKGKPDRLSDVMKIIQKRDDLKNNPKKLEPVATIEFDSAPGTPKDPLAKFSGTYLFTGKRSKPKGFDLQAARSNLLLFKINRENEDRTPKFELVDYHPEDDHHHPKEILVTVPPPEDYVPPPGGRRGIFRAPRLIAFNPAMDGTFLESVILGERDKRILNINNLTTEVVKNRRFLSEENQFFKMEYNFSRQRSWRDYVTNPNSIHPVLQDDRENEDNDRANAFQKHTVDFISYFGGKEEIVWSFDFTLLRENYWSSDIYSRFIEEHNWFVIASSCEEEEDIPPTRIFHCDLRTKQITNYSFPEVEDGWGIRNFGIFEDLIYYSREVEDNELHWDEFYLVFGYLNKSNRKRKRDSVLSDDPLNELCFLEYRGLESEDCLSLSIGTEGSIHLALLRPGKETDVFTFKINDIKLKIPESEKTSIRISPKDSEETTLPLIKLEEFCIPKYRDFRENLSPRESDVGYIEGNKFHLLV